MECVFACLRNSIGHYRYYISISKRFEPNALFVWKCLDLLFFPCPIIHGFNGLPFRSKPKIEKETAHLGSYQYLLFDCWYVYTGMPYGALALKRVVVVLFGLGNCFVRNDSEIIFYR